MPVAGGQARTLLTRPGDQRPTSWSPDGRVLALTDGTLGDTDIWTWTPGAEPAPLVATPGVNESEAVFAADGKHLAFTSAESGRPEVYVLPFPGPGDRIRVSENAGREPRWSRDGRELYFRQDDATMMVASVAQGGSSLVFGKPRQVLQLSLGLEPVTNYDVAPDGRRLLGIHNLNVRPRNWSSCSTGRPSWRESWRAVEPSPDLHRGLFACSGVRRQRPHRQSHDQKPPAPAGHSMSRVAPSGDLLSQT